MTQQSIFRTWVFGLPLRMQSMLLLAMRGADGAPREDKSEVLVQALRKLLLNDVDPLEIDFSEEHVESFANNIDHYRVRFLRHFTHAAEIVGYKHPDHFVRGRWISIYKRICKSLHVNFETETQLDARLGHTPEFLEQQRSKVEKVAVPVLVKTAPTEVVKSERPIELDLDGGPVPRYEQEVPAKGKCTCAHEFQEHYELKPESQPGVYECSGTIAGGGKCKCVKYDEVKPAVPKSGAKNSQDRGELLRALTADEERCVCGHAESWHRVPNFSGSAGRCSANRCGCMAFRQVNRNTTRSS